MTVVDTRNWPINKQNKYVGELVRLSSQIMA